MVDARIFVLPERGEVILSYPRHVAVLFDSFEMRFKSGETEESKGKGEGEGNEEGETGEFSQPAEMINAIQKSERVSSVILKVSVIN